MDGVIRSGDWRSKPRRSRGAQKTEFVGGNVTPAVRTALLHEAARRGLNFTQTLEEIILAAAMHPQSEAETAA